MARASFDTTLTWLISQLVLEIDDITTISGLASKPITTVAMLQIHALHLKALNNRGASYQQLVQRLTDAVQVPEEAAKIDQVLRTLASLSNAIGSVMGKVQVEISRRENSAAHTH